MLNELRIPRMGSVENAKLIAWHVAEGASYDAGDLLYEIETDKTTTEVDATEPGVLARQLAAPDEEFKVGDRVGLWATAGTSAAQIAADLSALDGVAAAPAETPPRAGAPAALAECAALTPSPSLPAGDPAARPLSLAAAAGRRISPLARRLAAQHGVDVTRLAGSGAGGKITGKDVLAAAAAPAPSQAEPHAAPAARPRRDDAPADAAERAPARGPVSGARVVPHSLRRKTIARRMTDAGAIPSLTADMEVDLGPLFEHRKTADGQGASVVGLIAHAAVAALLENRALNAHWGEEALTEFDAVHLGIAVDTAGGLVVPVIRNAERLSPPGLTGEIARLGQAARDGALRQADLEGGTFTLSNPGSLGPVVRAEALLNPPQIALLGLPGIVRAPRAVADGDGWAIAVKPVIRPSLTFDHRALDGGPVIRFLNTLKARLESL